jgi:F0F1-type ATP synthase assembly protein I
MIKNLLSDDEPEPQTESQPSRESISRSSSSVQTLFDSSGLDDDGGTAEDFVVRNDRPQSSAETFRQTGLAWSAGVAFGGAVIFMLVLGWGADVLLGTSPWGLVGGIVLGSVIGFIQFFRITSQIFKK